MAYRDESLPDSPVDGLVPTLNKTGWMTLELDAYSKEFAAFAGEIGRRGQEALDIGCAYGVATLAALEQGARVCASDMDEGHLQILANRVPEDAAGRFRCRQGVMPEIDFDSESFGAILAARVFHFLDAEQIAETLRKMHRWLQVDGQLYIVADTPYTGPWSVHAGSYERKKAAGDPWPGFCDDYAALLSEGTDPDGHPDFINPLDPDILARECRSAGFEVLKAEFLAGPDRRAADRAHAGVVARKTPN